MLNEYFYRIIRDLYRNDSIVNYLDEDLIRVYSAEGIEYIYFGEFSYVEDIIRKIEGYR